MTEERLDQDKEHATGSQVHSRMLGFYIACAFFLNFLPLSNLTKSAAVLAAVRRLLCKMDEILICILQI